MIEYSCSFCAVRWKNGVIHYWTIVFFWDGTVMLILNRLCISQGNVGDIKRIESILYASFFPPNFVEGCVVRLNLLAEPIKFDVWILITSCLNVRHHNGNASVNWEPSQRRMMKVFTQAVIFDHSFKRAQKWVTFHTDKMNPLSNLRYFSFGSMELVIFHEGNKFVQLPFV